MGDRSDDPFTPATVWAAAIRAKEVSPVEVAGLYLDRIDKLDAELNAFCHRADDDVRAAAERAADVVATTLPADLPPFVGVPLPIKDLNPVAGWPCTYGSRGAPGGPADENDFVVDRLVEAGFVPLGITNSPEFGTVSYTESLAHGVTRNPWDPGRTPGGSSGGAAAAVASGMAPMAQASDGGGSIRIPSACCGLVGLKPSRNRVPAGVNQLEGFSTNGVVSRTVADTAAALDVLGRPDPLSWYNAPPPAAPWAVLAAEQPPRLRVAWQSEPPLELPVDPVYEVAGSLVLSVLEHLGHDIVDGSIDLPDVDAFIASFTAIWNTNTADHPGFDWDAVEPLNLALRREGQGIDAIAYVEQVLACQRLSRVMIGSFGKHFDILVTPTMATLPPLVGTLWEGSDDDPMAAMWNCLPMAIFTSIFNVTGLPAISLPVHHDEATGLPVAVQLVAAPWREDLLLQLATVLEQALPWVHRRPLVS